MLARLPLATPVHSVRGLARRLVLTKADAPVGQALHSFQSVRIKALLDAGLIAEAAKLATQVRLKDDPEFTRLQAQAILLGGSPADACSDATLTRQSDTEPFWMQLRAYCYAIAGQSDLLEITRGVMKSEGADDKPFEILLDDALEHKSMPPGELHDPTAVEIFLMRLVGLPISPGLAARFGPPISTLAFRDAANPAVARADAAAQVLHTGAATASELNAVADAQTFSPQQMKNAKIAAAALPFFLGQALIRQAVARETDENAKGELLETAFRLARQAGLLPVAAMMQQHEAAMIMPSPALRSFARSFTKALLLARQSDAAERWRELLDVNNDADRALAAELAVELNLVAPTPGRALRAQEALSWLSQNVASNQPEGGPDEQRYDALALALYDALGQSAPVSAQSVPAAPVKWLGRDLAPATRKRIDETVGQPGMKGEAILTILDAVGAEGPGDLSPDAAAFLVRALIKEGEGESARALAVDALLLSGRYSPS